MIDYSEKEHTTSRRLLLLEPKADCDPTLARPEERKLPGPESHLGCHLLPTPGVWSMKIFSAPPSLLALLVAAPAGPPNLLPPARFQPHASIRGSLARSHTLARWSPGAFRRARTAHPQQLGPAAPPPLIDSCAIPPPVIPVKSITCAGRVGGFLATAGGVETAWRCENPSGWGSAQAEAENESWTRWRELPRSINHLEMVVPLLTGCCGTNSADVDVGKIFDER